MPSKRNVASKGERFVKRSPLPLRNHAAHWTDWLRSCGLVSPAMLDSFRPIWWTWEGEIFTALRRNRCPTVAQTAAKRTIRTDLPSARQPKKKYRTFCGLGMRNGNMPTDCLLWYPQRAVYFCHKLYIALQICCANFRSSVRTAYPFISAFRESHLPSYQMPATFSAQFRLQLSLPIQLL